MGNRKSTPVTGLNWPRGWIEVQLYPFVTSALEGGGWLAPRPGRFSKKTRYPLYRRLGGPQGRSGCVRKMSPQPGFFCNTFFIVISQLHLSTLKLFKYPHALFLLYGTTIIFLRLSSHSILQHIEISAYIELFLGTLVAFPPCSAHVAYIVQ
jgi:hypothetical protein